MPGSRLAHDRDDLAATLLCQGERLAQMLHLESAADEAHQPPPRRYLELRPQRSDAEDFVAFDGLTDSLHPRRPHRFEAEVSVGQPVAVLAHQDRSRSRQALHPRREIHRVSDRGIVRVQIVLADRSQHYLARVDADADLEWQALLEPQPIRISRDLFLHPQSRTDRALRVILVSYRRTEKRHDAVSRRASDEALVAMHGFHHPPQRRLDDAARLLGVEILHQLDRGLDVRKERRDRFPLALLSAARLHRRLLGEDTFGEVRWRVRAGITSAGLRDAVVAEWGSTFATEFRMG